MITFKFQHGCSHCLAFVEYLCLRKCHIHAPQHISHSLLMVGIGQSNGNNWQILPFHKSTVQWRNGNETGQKLQDGESHGQRSGHLTKSEEDAGQEACHCRLELQRTESERWHTDLWAPPNQTCLQHTNQRLLEKQSKKHSTQPKWAILQLNI